MSILNAWCTPARVLVAVDTEARRGNESNPHFSKLIPLVGPHVVLAFRGDAIFGQIIASDCFGVAGNFDDLDEAMPAWIAGAPGAVAKIYAGAAEQGIVVPPLIRQEIFLCGWSDRRAKMTARVFEMSTQPSNSVSVNEVEGGLASPDPTVGGFSPPNPCDTEEAMIRLAFDQVRMLRRIAPGEAAGGRLVLCGIDRKRMRIWTGAALGESPRVKDGASR